MADERGENPDTGDEATARLLLAWVKRLEKGEQGWDRPIWLRQALAALLVGQMRGRLDVDEIERELLAALIARVKFRAGEPPVVGDRHDDWREGAYVAAKKAVEAMAGEQPHLVGRVYVDAVTGPQPDARD